MKKKESIVLPPIVELDKQDKRVLIFMHGLGGDAHDVFPIATMLQKYIPEFHIILPNAPIAPVTLDGGMPMPSWYDIISLQPPIIHCEHLQQAIDDVAQCVQEFQAEGCRSLFLAGFSQGGSVALGYAATQDTKIGGIIAISSFLPNCPKLIRKSALASPVLLLHGKLDDVVPVEYSLNARDTLQGAQYREYNVAHKMSEAQMRDIGSWIHTQSS